MDIHVKNIITEITKAERPTIKSKAQIEKYF